MSSRLRIFLLNLILGVIASADILIDVPPPSSPSSPWHSLAGDPVITYVFDGPYAWTAEEKSVAYSALGNLDANLPSNTLKEEGDFSIRWAGPEFFKDWRDATHTADGWNLTNPLAVAYKHGGGPWDQSEFPNNEIYFNRSYPWSFKLFSVDAGKYDFWTVLMHETIHMLACDAHAVHRGEVMYESIGMGQRKFLQMTDLQILIGGGYNVPAAPIQPYPEPAMGIPVACALAWIVYRKRRAQLATRRRMA